MINDEIREKLLQLRDEDYRAFQTGLLPTVPPDTVLGVRTPALRGLAKVLSAREDLPDFLNSLPHGYFEENQLHAFLISGMKDFDACLEALERFLPFVDNWATCDQMSPKLFQRHRAALLPHIEAWISGGGTYAVRFGIGMLMEHYLDSDFDAAYPALVADVRSDEYYVCMMVAWYFATALAKQYDAVLPIIEERRLAPWTHNKAIQKAIESRRISPEQKAYLRSLKVKNSQR